MEVCIGIPGDTGPFISFCVGGCGDTALPMATLTPMGVRTGTPRLVGMTELRGVRFGTVG